MTLAGAVETVEATAPPRARGAVRLSVKARDGRTVLDGLRVAGSLKLAFPRPVGTGFDAVLVNTAGGVTGGDRFTTEVAARAGTALTLTTQAAERAYRAQGPAPGRVSTRLAVADGARLAWLPQETILFDGADFARSLVAELEPGARLLLVEPVVFGRTLMGEELRRARFSDRVEIRRGGATLWFDATRLAGDVAATLDRPAVAAGARAAALVVYTAPDAEPMRDRLRALLPVTGGASLVAPELLVARIVAKDGYALRQTLVPALKLLNENAIPRPWML